MLGFFISHQTVRMITIAHALEVRWMYRASGILRTTSTNAFSTKPAIIFFSLAKELKFLLTDRADFPVLTQLSWSMIALVRCYFQNARDVWYTFPLISIRQRFGYMLIFAMKTKSTTNLERDRIFYWTSLQSFWSHRTGRREKLSH